MQNPRETDHRFHAKLITDSTRIRSPVPRESDHRFRDRETGETREAQLFVACLAASQLIYGELTWDQTLEEWIKVHIHALEYFGAEILEERYGIKSTIVMSQLACDVWHQTIGDPTLADAILDRLVRCATRLI